MSFFCSQHEQTADNKADDDRSCRKEVRLDGMMGQVADSHNGDNAGRYVSQRQSCIGTEPVFPAE